MATNRPEPNRKRPDKAPPAGVHAAAASGREISEQEARKEIWDEPGGDAMARRQSKAAGKEPAGAGKSGKPRKH